MKANDHTDILLTDGRVSGLKEAKSVNCILHTYTYIPTKILCRVKCTVCTYIRMTTIDIIFIYCRGKSRKYCYEG